VTTRKPALESGDLVVDIGCNDGTLLDGYQTEGLRYLSFDPSDVARYAIAKGYDVVNDFYSAQALRQRRPDEKAKALHVYGASTKGNTILQYAGIDSSLIEAADRNPDKWGSETIATKPRSSARRTRGR